jgi:hypothetical protein
MLGDIISDSVVGIILVRWSGYKIEWAMSSADIQTQNTALLLREQYASRITTLPASERDDDLNNINVYSV